MPMLAFTSSFDWHSLELQYTMDYKKQIFTLKMDGSMNVNRNFNIDESTLGCLKNAKSLCNIPINSWILALMFSLTRLKEFNIDESTLGCLKNAKVHSNNMLAFRINLCKMINLI